MGRIKNALSLYILIIPEEHIMIGKGGEERKRERHGTFL